MPTAKSAGRRLRSLRDSDDAAVVGGIGVTSITPSSWSFGMRAISITAPLRYFNEFVRSIPDFGTRRQTRADSVLIREFAVGRVGLKARSCT